MMYLLDGHQCDLLQFTYIVLKSGAVRSFCLLSPKEFLRRYRSGNNGYWKLHRANTIVDIRFKLEKDYIAIKTMS